MNTKTIKQTVTFDAPALEVYNLIMDAKKHSAFSGTEVIMSQKPNGKFSVFDGYCHGYNIELIKGKKIVQAWHFAEDGWPDKHFSICTFQFDQQGNKTRLSFQQTDVPEHKAGELEKGWKQYYWKPMKDFLKKN
jgi:activator of HSP90 ATPase